MLDRWQVLAEAALVVVIVELVGAYYFVYLTNR